MPVERFFTNKPSLSASEKISLENEEFHHLFNVLRLKQGESIELINGQGFLAQGIIQQIEKRQAKISIESVFVEKAPSYQLILMQALPRLPRLEYILEKSVELGVTHLWLFPGVLSEKKELSSSQIKRAEYIILSAMKQCGRLFAPELKILPPLLDWKESTVKEFVFFGDTRKSAPLILDPLLKNPSSVFSIAIGPEKGFHEKEVLHMENSLQFQGIRLHKNILRTDTAAIESLSIAAAFICK